MKLEIAKYDDDDSYYAVNKADYDAGLNSVANDPAIIQELRHATNEIILRHARLPGKFAVKISVALNPPRAKVRGYATFLHLVQGCSLSDLENTLGFRSGVLQQNGAYLYVIDALALNQNNIAPRGNTDWSAGISPRDIDNLSKAHGKTVQHHRNYPAASKPIIQFALLEEVPILGPVRLIKPGEVV
ncbi:MAG: hypothetical protein AB3X44_17530 [Leptothrix sp. (in: b-proteobacteria)]